MTEILPEDYQEAACPLCMTPPDQPAAGSVPVNRILDKLDTALDRKDFSTAERILKYWISEAETLKDFRGELSLRNEAMGFYRKGGNSEAALFNAGRVQTLIEENGMEQTVGGGMMLLNAGTVYTAFDRACEGLPLFLRAEKVLTALLPPEDNRLAGLYNNSGLCYSALGQYDKAEESFRRALSVLESDPGSAPEQAVSWLNLADVFTARMDPEEAAEACEPCLESAERLLMGSPMNGNTAFVYEKCAPVMDAYGWFACAQILRDRAKEYYERS